MRSRLQPVGESETVGNFQVVEATEADPPRAVSVPEKQIMDLLIRGLSQRALTFMSTLFTLLLAGSAFWAWMTVLISPTVPQLVGLGGYAAFILALEFVRRR